MDYGKIEPTPVGEQLLAIREAAEVLHLHACTVPEEEYVPRGKLLSVQCTSR